MSIQDNENVVRTFFAAVNQHDADRAVSLVDQNVEWYTAVAASATMYGPEALKQSMQAFWTAFPDNRVEVTNMMVTEDWVTVEYIGRGSQEGQFTTPYGQVPPTGRHIELRSCDVYQIKNGKIIRGHSYCDLASLFQQIGAMPRIGQRSGLSL